MSPESSIHLHRSSLRLFSSIAHQTAISRAPLSLCHFHLSLATLRPTTPTLRLTLTFGDAAQARREPHASVGLAATRNRAVSVTTRAAVASYHRHGGRGRPP
jgi:hypothetical protein